MAYHINRNKILQITARQFPPEIRVLKECLSLVEAGYDCAVLCPAFKGQAEKDYWRGIKIYRFKVPSNFLNNLDKMLYFSFFFSYYWCKALKQVINDYNPGVLHVHDIWLGRTTFFVKNNEKIIIDLHENMPDAVNEYAKSYRGLPKLLHVLFQNHLRIKMYERSLLCRSDKIFVVVEEAKQRVLNYHPNLNNDKIVNIENLESIEFIQNKRYAVNADVDGPFVLLYIGGFGPHRGLDTMIESMGYIKSWGLNIELHLVGAKKGIRYLNTLNSIINDLNLYKYVKINNWVPSNEVYSYIKNASVGVVPHHSNPHTNHTIPHKLYQYMIASKPVLVSTSPPLARTVQAANSGVIFNAGDPADCANKIREMYSNPNQLKIYGSNGYKYVIEDGHNWEEKSAPTLVDAYNYVSGNNS